MDDVPGLRPFPARNFDQSTAFYEAPGFLVTHKDAGVAVLKLPLRAGTEGDDSRRPS